MRLLFQLFSTEIMLRKEILTVREKIYTISLAVGKLEEKLLKENTGSDKGKLVPTDIGTIVTDFLVKNFGNILDYNFTAKVEQDFDEIAEGNVNWTEMMQEFYDKFHPTVKDVEANAERESGERILGKIQNKSRFVRLGNLVHGSNWRSG
jgi:DNA topoisomerase-1